MNYLRVYEIGKANPLTVSIPSLDEKLDRVAFPYQSKTVIGASLFSFLLGILLGIPTIGVNQFAGFTIIYASLAASIALYLYPAHIFYFNRLRSYREEMLRAVLRLSVHISLDMSLDAAFVRAADEVDGLLGDQLTDIKHRLQRKQASSLGEAMQPYVTWWNEVNPVFMKSIKLLQTASLSSEDQREQILGEIKETMLTNYTTLGKRFAEDLSNNAKKLIGVGVLLPILSLLVLPIISVFLPELVRPQLLAFIYIILFPTVTLLLAMNFSAKRIHVDTVRIQDAKEYTPVPDWVYIVCGMIIMLAAIPTIVEVQTAFGGSGTSIGFLSILRAWSFSFGLYVAAKLFTWYYTTSNHELWEEVRKVEDDLPHLLQSFSTYLSLNKSVENIIPAVAQDYRDFGFTDHPVVRAFDQVTNKMATSKKRLADLIEDTIQAIIPSNKVTAIISQILSFSKISQDSATRVSKMIREQVSSLKDLDDYLQTLLADSVSLIKSTILLLAPLLTSSAVTMSVAIVKSLVFITEQFQQLGEAFGLSGLELQLVDTSNIVPPVIIEAIVGIYLVEILLVLAYFQTLIEVGNDRYKMAESMNSSLNGFLIYSVLLFGGFYFVLNVLFPTITAG